MKLKINKDRAKQIPHKIEQKFTDQNNRLKKCAQTSAKLLRLV